MQSTTQLFISLELYSVKIVIYFGNFCEFNFMFNSVFSDLPFVISDAEV